MQTKYTHYAIDKPAGTGSGCLVHGEGQNVNDMVEYFGAAVYSGFFAFTEWAGFQSYGQRWRSNHRLFFGDVITALYDWRWMDFNTPNHWPTTVLKACLNRPRDPSSLVFCQRRNHPAARPVKQLFRWPFVMKSIVWKLLVWKIIQIDERPLKRRITITSVSMQYLCLDWAGACFQKFTANWVYVG